MSWLSKFDQNAEIIWKWGTRAVIVAGLASAGYGGLKLYQDFKAVGQKLTHTAEKARSLEESLKEKGYNLHEKARAKEEAATDKLHDLSQATKEKWDGVKKHLPHRNPPPAASAPADAQPN